MGKSQRTKGAAGEREKDHPAPLFFVSDPGPDGPDPVGVPGAGIPPGAAGSGPPSPGVCWAGLKKSSS